jgi:hypothetical protein
MEVKTMKEVLGKLPVTWDGMIANHLECPAGTDFKALLIGLPDDKCHCPHWGYVLKGSLHVGYADGTEEVLKAGEAWYMPPGHTVWTTDEDAALVFFSPEKEETEVMEHIPRRQEELSQVSG